MTSACLFGEHPEIQELAKKHDISRVKYKTMPLEEIKKQALELFRSFTQPPVSKLEERRATLQRVSGIYEAWIPCTIIITKDRQVRPVTV